MGLPAGEAGHGKPEEDLPDPEAQHDVRLTRRFAVCDREISNRQYARFLAEQRGNKSESRVVDGRPADSASWYDAVDYCVWLTKQTNLKSCYLLRNDTKKPTAKSEPNEDAAALSRSSGADSKRRLAYGFHPERSGFRLLTEGEWEYACRAATITRFAHGSDDSLLKTYAHYGESFAFPAPTSAGGTLRPNPRGLFDMHGNVWEWCADAYSQDLSKHTNDPYVTEGERNSRVLRGGGWHNNSTTCRSAARLGNSPDSVSGFRVCVSVVAARTP